MVGAVKYAWFNNPVFRRAVSMAIDRDALIRGPFRGFAIKNWQLLTQGNRAWYDSSDRGGADYDPRGARAKLLAGLGLARPQRRRGPRGRAGQPGPVHA